MSTTEVISSIVSGFSTQLLQQLYNAEDNLFFSPASIAVALAMTWAGSDGETRQEMNNALFKGSEEDAVHSSMGAFLRNLNAKDQPFTLSTANKLYCQQSYAILESFVKVLADNYDNFVESVDFVTETEKSRLAINDWVAGVTNQKINDLLAPGIVDSLTRLVLVNAVYFKGDWKDKFDEAATNPMPFHVSKEKTVDVPMMFMEEEFPVTFDETVAVLKLPYRGESLSFAVILPHEVDGLSRLVEGLTDDKLHKLLSQPAHKSKVMVHLPKFKLESKFNLNDVLKKCGVNKLFSTSEADLSRITQTDRLHVSAVVHKAFIEVNEEGSEAAAATAVGICMMCMPPQVVCDHPFLFAIWDERQKAVLFLGAFMTPPS